MKFKDTLVNSRRYTQPVDVEPLSSGSYSKDEIDLKFEYRRGAEDRIVRLALNRDEATALRDQLNEFLNDDQWGPR